MVASPGSLGMGKIMSLVDFNCSSTGDDEYGRLSCGAPNTEGGRHVKVTDSSFTVEFDTHEVTCPGVARENATSDFEMCELDHMDALCM